MNDLKVDDITGVTAQPGTWNLEVSSWSPENGFPRTGEFGQGRLIQASTFAQPTTFWMSAPDGFDDYGVGIKADDAIDYSLASKMINRLEWIAENIDPFTQMQTSLYFGGTNAEFIASSGAPNAPFGGDVVPLVNKSSDEGSAPVQAVTAGNKILFLDRSRRKIFIITYSEQDYSRIAIELTALAEHITGSGISLGPIAVQKRPDRRFFWVRSDGQLVVFTYLPNEKVIGFSRFVTDGEFQSVCCVSNNAPGNDIVYVIVKRVINGQTKRYVEVFEDEYTNALMRPWKSFQTDCAICYRGPATAIVSGLGHLEGKLVDVVADGGFRGQKTVVSGQVMLDEEFSEIEVGLHYNSKLTTMRPSIPNVVIEGLPRSWSKLFVRLKDSLGGKINGNPISYPPFPLGSVSLFTGDRPVTPPGITGNDTNGAIEIIQDQPYPLTILCTFGTLTIGDHD